MWSFINFLLLIFPLLNKKKNYHSKLKKKKIHQIKVKGKTVNSTAANQRAKNNFSTHAQRQLLAADRNVCSVGDFWKQKIPSKQDIAVQIVNNFLIFVVGSKENMWKNLWKTAVLLKELIVKYKLIVKEFVKSDLMWKFQCFS